MTKEESWKQYYESDHSLFDGGLDENDLVKIQQIFYDGYHECQKEYEWHYVKDCLPPKKKLDVGAKSESVYVTTRGYGIYIGYYNFSRKVWYLADNDYQEIPEVYAWCELPVPPKEIE